MHTVRCVLSSVYFNVWLCGEHRRVVVQGEESGGGLLYSDSSGIMLISVQTEMHSGCVDGRDSSHRGRT